MTAVTSSVLFFSADFVAVDPATQNTAVEWPGQRVRMLRGSMVGLKGLVVEVRSDGLLVQLEDLRRGIPEIVNVEDVKVM